MEGSLSFSQSVDPLSCMGALIIHILRYLLGACSVTDTEAQRGGGCTCSPQEPTVGPGKLSRVPELEHSAANLTKESATPQTPNH